MDLTQLDLIDSSLEAATLSELPLPADGDSLDRCAEELPGAGQIEQVVAELASSTLSGELRGWVERYTAVGTRAPYLWNWVFEAVRTTTLPCVAPEHLDHVCDTKTMGVMWDVMLDDLADRGGDAEVLDRLLDLPMAGLASSRNLPNPESEYERFAGELWQEICHRAESYPRFAEFAELLRFDYLQLSNAMRYATLLNSNLELLNLTEHDLYSPHNMHMMVCATFDLMCSTSFDRAELGALREIVWMAQSMGRIGNLVTTWQRELHEGDFTSGVYARAVSCRDLSSEMLRHGDPAEIERVILENRHEDFFLNRWQTNRQQILASRARFREFDVAKLVAGLDRLICLHLGSRGSK